MGKEINTGSSVILHYRTYPLNYKKTLVCLLLLSFGKNNWTGILGDLPSWEHIISSYPTFGKRKNHLRGWSVGVLGYDSMGIPGIYCQLGFFVCYNSPTKKTEPEKQSSISWRFLFFEVSMVSMDQISPQDQDRSTYTSVFPWKKFPPEIEPPDTKNGVPGVQHHRLGPRQTIICLGPGKPAVRCNRGNLHLSCWILMSSGFPGSQARADGSWAG